MRSWKRLSWLVLVLLLLPAPALAGGSGVIRLAQPLERAGAGDKPVYVQALQHGIHPRGDAVVSVTARGPAEQTVQAGAALDPRFGADNVFVAHLALQTPGAWQVTVAARCWVYFPEYSFRLQVLPAGAPLPEPAPVRPYHDTSGESDAGGGEGGPCAAGPGAAQPDAAAAPAPAQVAPPAPPAAAPSAGRAWPLAAAAVAVGASLAVALLSRPH